MPINAVEVSSIASLILDLVVKGQAAYVQLRQNEGLSLEEAWAECDRQSKVAHDTIASEKARLADSV